VDGASPSVSMTVFDNVLDSLRVDSTFRVTCWLAGVEAGCVRADEGVARDEAEEGEDVRVCLEPPIAPLMIGAGFPLGGVGRAG
jgi:hypothetical protein